MKPFISLLILGLLCAIPAAAANKAPLPVGEVTFEATTVGAGATFSWGRGWFHYRGKDYPIKVDGLGLIGVGYAKVRARGKVYHLKEPREITGTYAQLSAGAALVAGGEGFWAKNDKGVVLELLAEQKGVSFSLGGGSFTITMTLP